MLSLIDEVVGNAAKCVKREGCPTLLGRQQTARERKGAGMCASDLLTLECVIAMILMDHATFGIRVNAKTMRALDRDRGRLQKQRPSVNDGAEGS